MRGRTVLANRLVRHGFARVGRSLRERIFHHAGWDFTTPAFVQCVLTERCNYKCQYCSHWRMETYSEEMSAGDWESAILSLKQLINPLLIDFSGGEPTIYPHFLELVEFCRSESVDWIITTNGSTLSKNRFVQRLVAAQPLKVDISVDSASEDIHDSARGVPGSLARIEQGIRMLVSERDRSGQNFAIRIKVTVHRLNASKLVPIVCWSEGVGATSVDFNAVGGLWRKEDIERLSIQDSHDLAVLQDQVEELVKLRSKGAPIETGVDALRGIVAQFSGAVEFGNARCRDPLRNFVISPRGDVRGCGCSAPVGNIRQQPAELIWRSEAARQARRKSLGCSLKVAVAKGTNSCTAHRTIVDDVRRAMLLLGLKSRRSIQ
jgi:MoaA/NifB/PqqE/SkfB family radical SAM enzyme